MTIHADARCMPACSMATKTPNVALDPTRKAYVHLVRGALEVNGQRLSAGDALKLQGESKVTLANGTDAEVLVFDLAP